MYRTDLEVPARYQSEPSSAPSQSENCGVTVSAAILDFFHPENAPHHIEQRRWSINGMGPYNVNGRIYFGSPPQTPTNAWQQADMLRVGGVPCTVVLLKAAKQIHAIVDSGRRPILLGLNFAYVPDATAGHTFQSWHAIKVRDGDAGIGNFIVNDPNFWASGADATNGKRWYSDTVIQNALNATGGAYAVVPNAAKPAAVPDTAIPSAPAPEPDEMKWSHLFVHEHRKFRVLAGTNFRAGPGPEYDSLYYWTGLDESGKPAVFERMFMGYVPLPDDEGLWRAVEDSDGKGMKFVANSRMRAVA